MSVEVFLTIFPLKNILIYLAIINVVGFFAMYIDKQKAKKGEWRIPEKSLFILTIIGGGIGTLTGMYLFRHKTKKLKFTVGFPVILITEIALVVYWITR